MSTTTNPQPRQTDSIVNTGLYATKTFGEAETGLEPDTFDDTIDRWLSQSGYQLPEPARELFVEKLGTHHIIDDLTLQVVYREVVHETEPVTNLNHENLRVITSVVGDVLNDGGHSALASSLQWSVDKVTNVSILGADNPSTAAYDDPRVQAGEVFDLIVAEDGTVFERYQEGGRGPMWPGRLRFQTSRPLAADETEHFFNLTNYAWAAEIHGVDGDVKYEEADSAFSFTAGLPNHLNSSNIDRFVRAIRNYTNVGSKVRSSDLVAPKGTRKYEGIPDAPTVEVYYEKSIDPE